MSNVDVCQGRAKNSEVVKKALRKDRSPRSADLEVPYLHVHVGTYIYSVFFRQYGTLFLEKKGRKRLKNGAETILKY